VLFVVGEAGIGKSRLVHETWRMAAARGVRSLRGRAVPGSDAAAFRPLAEALGAVVPEGLEVDELAPWLPALSAVVPTVAPIAQSDAGAEATAAVRGEAVLRLLRSVCGSAGGLLVLEDLQWADPETVAVVEHLSDNLYRAPVLCVVTVRSDEDSPALDMVRRVAARRSAQVLEPRRLNDAQVAAMVHSCTGGVDPAAVDRIVSLADGVPFLVEEMLVSPGLPASFASAVETRLRQLPAHEFEAAAAAARVAAPGNRDIDGMLVGACEVYAALMTDDIERALAGAQRCADLLRGSETAPPMHARAAWPLLLAVNRRSEAPAAIEELERAGLAVSRAGRGTLLMARAVMAARADRVRAGELAVQADELLVDVPLAVRRTSARRRGGGGGRLDDPRCLDDRGRGVAARSRLPRPG
jgi:hypothetical protein